MRTGHVVYIVGSRELIVESKRVNRIEPIYQVLQLDYLLAVASDPGSVNLGAQEKGLLLNTTDSISARSRANKR